MVFLHFELWAGGRESSAGRRPPRGLGPCFPMVSLWGRNRNTSATAPPPALVPRVDLALELETRLSSTAHVTKRIFVTLVWHVMYERMNEGMVAVFISKTHATKLPMLGP